MSERTPNAMRGLAVSSGWMVALVAGCGSAAAPAPTRGNVRIADANNYVVTAALSIPTIDTAPGVDLDICWTHVTDDIQCHPLAAQTDLDNLALLRIAHLGKREVESKLSAGRLSQSQVAGYVDYHLDHGSTCAKLSQLTFFGTVRDIATDYIESAAYTYLLLLAKGTRPGVGASDMVFLNPTAASTNTTVDLSSGCGLLSFSADLTSVETVPVPATGPWIVDWQDITRDGQNNPVTQPRIDGVTIGLFQGMTTTDVQARILDIELIATSLWDLSVAGGKTADLSEARDRKTGVPFPGFAPAIDATWMLALTCSSCQSPAPIVLTILQPG